MRITPLTILVIALVAGGAWYFLARGENDPEDAGRSDRNAGVVTGPIEDVITTMRRNWDVADLDGLRDQTAQPEADDDSGGAIGYLERRLAANGWDVGIPPIESIISTDKTDTIRVTLTCKLAGISATHPLVLYWEWQDDAWRIATWKIPLAQ
ncbi:MAG: hypothetical protein GY946_18200 [bacterium]|nr:hypothetical protein [bacterium]